MSIALERSGPGGDQAIDRSGFVHFDVGCVSTIYDSPDFSVADRRDAAAVEGLADRNGSMSSSSTSSIGKNSDESGGGGGGGGVGGGDEEEVQSECKGGALDCLDALEEVLPEKKGISRFYRGKSKSFTSLLDAASCSSLKDIAKPENAYSRKRKNLMAYKTFWDKTSNGSNRGSRAGISKRPTNSRSMLALAAINSCFERSNDETSSSSSPSPSYSLPPLPPHARRIRCNNDLSSSPPPGKFSSWRSLSLTDLQGAAVGSSREIPSLWINNRDK